MNKDYESALNLQLNDFNKVLTALQDRANDIYDERYNVELKKAAILPLIILEDKLLEEAPWKVKVYNSSFYLDGGWSKERPRLSAFFAKVETGYHVNISLGDGHEVRISDGDIHINSILGEEQCDFSAFVRKWNLNVDTSEVEQGINEMVQQVSVLTEILTLFKKD